MFTIHATKKLLDRVPQPTMPAVSEPTTALGNRYATALFWKPQVGLLVNERTLLPVLMPLAPVATLIDRFPKSLQQTLEAHEISAVFIEFEIAAMLEGRYAKTASRSVVGIMNEFSYLAKAYRTDTSISNLVALAVRLSQTPCSPLYSRNVSPDRELATLVTGWPQDGQSHQDDLV